MTGKKNVQFIAPDAYPQMATPKAATAMLRALRGGETARRAACAIEEVGEALRAAVCAYVGELEQAGGDYTQVAALAHEIRGFAETAGMLATGRIAENLCRYFEESGQRGSPPDTIVVALHARALGSASRDPDIQRQMTDTVARELSVLADHKLAETGVKPALAQNAVPGGGFTPP